MKKLNLVLCTVVSLFALVSSSIWEGAAGVAMGGNLPETGLYIATNSFPLNTVVDVTNLETGRTIRVVAASPLEAAPGLVAMLSRDVAAAIGLSERSLGRIRMSQPPESVAFARFGQGRSAAGEPDFDPAAFAALPAIDPLMGAATGDLEAGDAWNRRTEGGDIIVNLPETLPPPAPDPFVPPLAGHVLTLVPSELRPPTEADRTPDPAFIIPGIEPTPSVPPAPQDPVVMQPFVTPIVPSVPPPPAVEEPLVMQPFVTPIVPSVPPPPAVEEPLVMQPFVTPIVPSVPPPAAEEPLVIQPFVTPIVPPPAPFPVFTAPMIHNLQAGMFYIQLAAYTNVEAIRYELARLDRIDPSLAGEVVVMRGLNPEHGAVYQILVGPLNHGESGALLHRFRNTHRDAFIRSGG